MNCSKCNNFIEDDSESCKKCGIKLNNSSSQRRINLNNKKSSKRFNFVAILIIIIINGILASVVVPTYNDYIRSTKDKIALNFAAAVAHLAATYYAQSQITPTSLTDVNINVVPVGLVATISATFITVEGDGTPGYVETTDFTTQSVRWHPLAASSKYIENDNVKQPSEEKGVFVYLPPGNFIMGSGSSEEDSTHPVNISYGFYMAKNLITQAEWDDYMSFIYPFGPGGTNLRSNKFGLGDDYPIYLINWFSTLIYCNKRSVAEGFTPCYSVNDTTDTDQWPMQFEGDGYNITGADWDTIECNWEAGGYRLPTEAEWEYAARYNDNRMYPWGNTEPVEGISNYGGFTNKTSLVGGYPQSNSELGISDMAGNTWEWCWDWYGPHPSTEVTDPKGASTGDWRVLKGGGWIYVYTDITSSYRTMNSPEYLFEGFRVVRKNNHPNINSILPNGGEILNQNSPYEITWVDNIDEKVKIELLENDSLTVGVIADSTESDGSFLWAIPGDYAGNDFKIRISSLIEEDIMDLSDSCFAIIPEKIMITSPNGGEKFLIDSELEIRWLDNLSENVKIELFKNDIFYSLINNSVPSTGLYNWDMPDSIFGNELKIKISSVIIPALYNDTSDSIFTITEGEISVTTPQTGETIEMLEDYLISWSGTLIGDVKISLFKSDSCVTYFTAPSTGQCTWDFYSPDLISGNDYHIKIESILQPDIFDETGDFRIKGTNNINGGVYGVWSESFSPFIITDSTYVSGTDSLLIESNVKVKSANQNNNFIVIGTLKSIGNQYDNIYFSDIALELDNGESTDSSRIFYTQFERKKITKAEFSLIKTNDNSKVIIQNCILKNSNSFGIDITNSSPVISNCLIYDNENGVSFNNSSTAYFANNTISNNQIGLYFDGNSDPMIINSIIYNNAVNQVYLNSDDSDPEFYYNNIQGGQIGFSLGSGVIYSGSYSSNIDSDPLFDEGTYLINESSPCYNNGYPELIPETLGYLYIPKKDIIGRNRLYGDIDIGCYEYWPSGMIPEVPTNILVSITDGIINLSWDECEGAISYNIYCSESPYGVFELLTTTGRTSWNIPEDTNSMKFIYIVSDSGYNKSSIINQPAQIKNKIKIPKIESMLR